MHHVTDTISQMIAAQRPGFSLEQPFYTDLAIFQHDMERAILPFWFFVGHSARIPECGDYFLANLAGESIIILRGQDDKIHALFNVCRHRGSRICLQEQGHARTLICPYHAWTYACDGSLLSARNMPEDFDRSPYALHRCEVRTMEGLIFINLSQRAEPCEEMFRDATEFLKPYSLGDSQLAHRQSWLVAANWKLVMENFRECYHCAPCHPQYCSVMFPGLVDERDALQTGPAARQHVAHWHQEMESRYGRTGQTVRSGAHMHVCCRTPLRDGYLTQSQDGRLMSTPLGNAEACAGTVTTFSFFPLHFTAACPDHATLFRFAPLEPLLTEVELTWLVDQNAVEGKDYNVERITWMWRNTTEQDVKIIENNQAGVNSGRYRPGPYSEMEQDLQSFVCWYLERVA